MSASLRRTERSEGRTTDKVPGPRHFLDLRDFDPATLRQMLDVAANYKRAGVSSRPLAGKTLALICTDLSPMKWSALRYGFRASGADPVCGPRPMQVLGL